MQHLNLQPVPPSVFNPDIPPALEALILHLLEKDPNRRPASAREVMAALEGVSRSGHQVVSTAELGAAPTLVRQLPSLMTLIGRREELEALKGRYEEVAGGGGGGRLVMVAGDAGTGQDAVRGGVRHVYPSAGSACALGSQLRRQGVSLRIGPGSNS